MATIANPTELLAWAVHTGRVPADDYDEWLANLTGPGGGAYVDQLLDRVPGKANRTMPPYD